MAFTINKTDGTVLTTVQDGTLDQTTNLNLFGKNYAGYGELLNENQIKLLENFETIISLYLGSGISSRFCALRLLDITFPYFGLLEPYFERR